MNRAICHGVPASWINGWLAAVGCTVVDSRIRLRWTQGASPRAILCASEGDPVALLAESWPARSLLEAMPLAENWGDTASVKRRVAVEVFAERAREARGHRHSWTLSSTMTDLHVDASGDVAHAPFDPAGPGTIKWLHHRLLTVHSLVDPSIETLMASLDGTGERVQNNGLGFDLTRLGSLADNSTIWTDPVIEMLAFFGLALLPVRGRGTDQTRAKSIPPSAIQRGWARSGGGRSPLRFAWPAWNQSLDRDGIDALLDLWKPEPNRKPTWARVGVHAAWRTVRYERRASADNTRGFGSERL